MTASYSRAEARALDRRVSCSRDILEEMELNGVAPDRRILQDMLESTLGGVKDLGDAWFYFDKVPHAAVRPQRAVQPRKLR